jgi:hypothetical protein
MLMDDGLKSDALEAEQPQHPDVKEVILLEWVWGG